MTTCGQQLQGIDAQENMGFAMLPVDVVLKVLNDFLDGIKDLSAMDIACSRSSRREFAAALCHNGLQFPYAGASIVRFSDKFGAYLKWTNARGICSQQLQLEWSTLEALFASLHDAQSDAACDKTMLPAVAEIILHKDKEFPSCKLFKSLLDMCPQLRSFQIGSISTTHDCVNIIVSALVAHPRLPLRSFGYHVKSSAQVDFTMLSVLNIVSTFHDTLEELSIRSVRIEANEFEAFCVCKQLRRLSCSASCASTDLIAQFLDKMPKLQNLAFSYFSCQDWTDDNIFEVSSKCFSNSRLQALSFSFISGQPTFISSCRAFASILKACPSLNTLRVDTIHYCNISSADRLGCRLTFKKPKGIKCTVEEVQCSIRACPFRYWRSTAHTVGGET